MHDGVMPVADEAEVVIVGAGPGGASCAALLAERGHDVLLVDQERFPRDKPCGDGLTRSTVGFLERLGLGDLVDESQPIEGVRVVMDHRSYEYKEYKPERGKPGLACCITRSKLDNALVDAAVERGARFLHARVTDRAPDGEHGVAAMIGGDRPGVIRSRYTIAADGATSRLRRVCGHGRVEEDMMAYAVRAYYRTERPLDPVFDVYVPLEFEGRGAVGYGWVFPIEENLANVGIGYWRGAGLNPPTRIREVLAAFVDELTSRAGPRFGELERVTKPFGSPLGVQFRRDRCEVDDIVFLGDAARTTDPLSGEGIAYAVHGAERVAELIHERSRGRPTTDAGTLLGRRFPRLGQDVSFPCRLAERRLNQLARASSGGASHPFLGAVQRVALGSEDDPTLADSPVGTLTEEDSDARSLLARVNDVVLDEMITSFPFAAELLHREFRSRSGPVAAATALFAGSGATDEEALVHGAAAVELTRVGSRSIREMVDRPRGQQAKLNNALCVLVSDFALSRALREATRGDTWLVRELSIALRRTCDGQLVEAHQLHDPDRSIDDYLAGARVRSSLVAVAARFGGLAAAQPPEVVDALGRFGWELGLACHVSEELVELLEGDQATGRGPAVEARHGAYGLPIVYAQAEDRGLRRLLMRGVEEEDVPELLERVLAAGGAASALELLAETVDRARALLGELNGHAAPLLADLATLMLTRAEEVVPAPVSAARGVAPAVATVSA